MTDREKKKKLLSSADRILDEYNDGKITKAQMVMCMEPLSIALKDCNSVKA